MNNQEQLHQLSGNLVDRINILNLNVNDINSKSLAENEKELKVLNELFVGLRKTIFYYNNKDKNKK